MNSTAASTGNESVLIGLLKLMRPRQWLKNGFVLAPLVFAGLFTDMTSVTDALLAMLLFSLASSTAYIINDYFDIEHDRAHPLKSQKRPLASDQVSKPQALALLVVLYAALVWGYFQQPNVSLVILAYLALSLAYTLVLKHQPVIDIFTLNVSGVLLERFRCPP